jgi:type II secretory pathway predicted ATPase ExeA
MRRAPKGSGARLANARLAALKASFNAAQIAYALMVCVCKPNVFERLVIQASVATLSEVVLIAAKASSALKASAATTAHASAARWMAALPVNFAGVTNARPIPV